MDRGAWEAAVHGVAKSRTRLSDFTFTFHFHALEKEMTAHSSVLAWRIPGIGEPGGLPSVVSYRVGHDWRDLAAAAAAAYLTTKTKSAQILSSSFGSVCPPEWNCLPKSVESTGKTEHPKLLLAVLSNKEVSFIHQPLDSCLEHLSHNILVKSSQSGQVIKIWIPFASLALWAWAKH